MSTLDSDKETIVQKQNRKEKMTLTDKNDGKTSRDRTASTEAEKALQPSDDEDLFDNMPI